jgi:hypothetical protein
MARGHWSGVAGMQMDTSGSDFLAYSNGTPYYMA